MPKPLRVALIMDPTAAHRAPLVDGLLNAEVGEVAAVDPSGRSFEEVRAVAGQKLRATYTDRDRAYRDFLPEVAIITLEPWRMPEAITQALEFGAHVFHDKPGCVRIEDYRAIYRLAKQRDRHLCIAYSGRGTAVNREARRLVAEGLLGDLFACHAWFIADHHRTRQAGQTVEEYNLASGGWFHSRQKAGGGALSILGCHYLDLMRYVTGRNFTSVAVMCAVVGGEPIEVEDAAVLSLTFDAGLVGTLQAGYYTTPAEYAALRHMGFMLWGRDGWLSFNPNGTAIRAPLLWASQRGYHAAAPHHTWVFDAQDATTNGFRLLFREFYRACQGEGPPPLAPEDGLWVNECIHAAYRAAETGQRQTIAIPAV
ncbi:MAG: Gfo/Idh/MocA family oxidoreductase [Actinobacteria bacterium]|nr:Gfo/Idh/MocA family oxidoreductase [Actinomycetota bacterium]